MRAYVIMGQRRTAISVFDCEPVEVFDSIKRAKKRVDELNEKAISKEYWYESVKFNKEPNQ